MQSIPIDRLVNIMKNTITSLLILVSLLIGIIIGILLSPHIERAASAQQKPASTPACAPSSDTECITPIMTVGSAGIGKLLSNEISSDHLAVNGYDILKLDNNLLNAMIRAGVVTPDQAKALVEDSHPDKYLRYQPAQPPPQPQTATPPTSKP